MGTSARSCWIEQQDGTEALFLDGHWRLADLRLRAAELDRLDFFVRSSGSGTGSSSDSDDAPSGGRRSLIVDGSRLGGVDTAGALLLLVRLKQAGLQQTDVVLRGFDPSHQRIIEVVQSRLPAIDGLRQPHPQSTLASLGRFTVELLALLDGHLEFFGRVLASLAAVTVRPRLLRVRETMAQLGQTGVGAIPVVALVTFLIGVVFTYLLGLQAEQFGANIFVVDGVALGMTRELSPLLVATIVAGRSGAAFTAQLGTMKLTEEIDAIRTLGLSPEQVLVVPRVLALVLALPLLVFVGDVMSLLGAMLMTAATLDITPTTFLERLQMTLAPRHYLIGLAKAPVFALFIAIIGCRMGFAVSRDTRSIGINTTSTVVQGIVAVILLDAIFAILLQELGL